MRVFIVTEVGSKTSKVKLGNTKQASRVHVGFGAISEWGTNGGKGEEL